MSQFPNQFGANRAQPYGVEETLNPAVIRFFNSVYSWMCAGLALTALVAWLVAQNPQLVAQYSGAFIFLFIAQIALVVVISRSVTSIGAGVATGLFLLYSALNGLTLSVIFMVYAHSALFSAFIISAGTFGAMSLYGMVTQRDLTGMGRILMMTLIGLVIASVVSIFWHNSGLQVLINYVGVLLFVGLTAYDTQKLKVLAYQTQNSPALAARMSIVGSLILYLDFINLFLFIVQIMGDRRR